MKQLIIDLAEARNTEKELVGMLKQKQNKFDKDNADLIDAINHCKGDRGSLEEILRNNAIDEFKKTGDKSFFDKTVQIKEIKNLQYNYEDAEKWAIEHKIFLTLDKKNFEKYAKSNIDTLPFGGVDIVYKAYIAKDIKLDKIE